MAGGNGGCVNQGFIISQLVDLVSQQQKQGEVRGQEVSLLSEWGQMASGECIVASGGESVAESWPLVASGGSVGVVAPAVEVSNRVAAPKVTSGEKPKDV